MKKVICIVQARMGSTRLAEKIMRPIFGVTVLGRCIDRMRRSEQVHQTVVATSDLERDQVIADWCLDHGVECFRGPENDVLTRYVECARQFSADVIVRVTSDCPLIDWRVVDRMVQWFGNQTTHKIVKNTWFKGGYPSGYDAEVFAMETLLDYDQRIVGECREHVLGSADPNDVARWSDVDSHVDLLPEGYDTLHLSVDTAPDLTRVIAIFSKLASKKDTAGFEEVMACLRSAEEGEIEQNVNESRASCILKVRNQLCRTAP